ncbi:MAG: TFIIB-type zinc ribbon-containing protein [Gemmatimonadales bacterium]
MSDKPSRNEDEYFAREDAERIRRLREQQAAEQRTRERQSHHMKCPKCGADLLTEAFHHVQIDRCPECHGIWLDEGEIDQLMAHEDPGVFRRVLSDVAASIRRLKAGS